MIVSKLRFGLAFIFILFASAALLPGMEKKPLTVEKLREMRKELAFKKRFVLNNDGCDALYFPRNKKLTVDSFLKQRTTDLAGTQVNTIFYCSISSGFGQFTHNTKVGEILKHSASDFGIAPDKRNVTSDLIALNTDPLQLVVDYGHAHQQEVFWSMRMNDTHDVAHTPEIPYFLFPQLKKDHPEWLIGNYKKRTPYGRWSSVDYARPEIRELAFRYIEEVCQNYDVDGVELDFFRHLCYFKSVAYGKKATERELELMTELLQRIRKMSEEEGIKRGRPILISIRVPDSVDYCKASGFDLERWMKEDLFDILVTTGYFRLNKWEHSIETGKKHGVAVYPCLSDSRVLGETRFFRRSLESLRARAMNAWQAGANGLYIYNHFNPNALMWKELGNPETIRYKRKLYFVTVRDGNPSSWLANGQTYRSVPILTPSQPQSVTADNELAFNLSIADNLQAAKQSGYLPGLTLHLEASKVVEPSQLIVRLNGHQLAKWNRTKNWLDYDVQVSHVNCGENRISIRITSAPTSDKNWNVIYNAENLPDKPWTADRGSNQTTASLDKDSLLVADRGTNSGDYLYYRYPWGTDASSKTVIEARVKVVSGHNAIIFTNGVSGNRLILKPDEIYLYHNSSMKYQADTTQRFHDYRIEMEKTRVKVFVDHVLKIDAPTGLAPRAGYPRNELAFGAANSNETGEAFWKSIKARTSNISIHDAVMSIDYSPQK